jgi:hypothetical protein
MNRACLVPVRARVVLLTSLLVVAPTVTAYAAPQEGAISFDFPGAANTQATAITPSGEIVGRYNNADGVLHGFLLADGHFTSIDYPGSVFTDVNWINPRGEIGGDYADGAGIRHGFVFRNGQFTMIDYPGAAATTVFGISATGELIGIWTSSQNTLRGFLAKGGHFTNVDFPGATATLPTMQAAGILTGGYVSASGTHGFEVVDGTYKTIDCPGATFTFLSGIDPEGNMVGGFGSPDGNYHGALIKDGNCIQVDYPGGHDTWANGSNAQGDLVGRYTDSGGVTHGYLLRRYIPTATPVYSAAAGFSATANPNAVWSYGFSDSVTGPFSLYTTSGTTYFSGEVGWFGPIPGCCAPGYPLVVAQPNVIPNVLDMGPGPSSYTIVRWTAPNGGVWDVAGNFFGTGVTTADVHVLHNGTALFDSPVNGSDVAAFSLAIQLKAGDTVDFAAGPGPGGDNAGDPTGFNVTITPKMSRHNQ